METNYIIIGDSITYGIGDFESGGWATMFKNYIVNTDDSKVGNNYVHIAGFPGATSSDILNKINSLLQSFIYEGHTNTVIIFIGVNDTQVLHEEPEDNREQYKSNIEKIAKIVTDKGCNLIILGLTSIESDEKFLWKPNKYWEYDRDVKIVLKYDAALKEVCKKNKIKYIPMQEVLEKNDFIDGLHPNQNGHKKIFEYIINRAIV